MYMDMRMSLSCLLYYIVINYYRDMICFVIHHNKLDTLHGARKRENEHCIYISSLINIGALSVFYWMEASIEKQLSEIRG